ncbi:MAG: autotransporter outer membrane beta-barrel domain-containing protein [Sterolibacteriaceae bacterium]|uniref:Autotransporter outer membrane beta-barrel domain-containing protein n=1 Tax=Candidatus Methylophosphatis roskildensis TaxID=2899263 RepID=A0A9D7E7Z9_9PROT|nr:autotransporter outer membrane beta-barrel domain-containing protein [Candidatus Methylophosphatis roskildensis]MBK7236200.1 autotransporter outer membrane beta-barrel domain-containing protein [Sterolibacteriaceae bacterium]
MNQFTHRSPLQVKLLATAIGSLSMASAYADLNLVPALNPVQASAANVTQTVCPQMAGAQERLTAAQQVLLSSCTKLIVTSNAQQTAPGQGTPGSGSFDLGLTTGGLRDALQAVAPEEMNGLSRARTTNFAKPLNARLLALRKGRAGGVAGSSFDINGQAVSLASLLPPGSTGGGASADGLGGRLGGFVNGHYNWGNRDASSLEDSFDFSDYGLTGGVDYRFTDALVAGVALSYSKTKADFDNSLGDVKSDDRGISLYGSYNQGGYYVDGHLGFAKIDFDTARRIVVVSTTTVAGFDTVARGSPSADQLTGSIGGGYDMVNGDLTISPFARLNYLRLKTDAFTEEESKSGLGLDVAGRKVTSLISALGVSLTKAISTGSGVISPYAGLEWNHEFRNNADGIVAKYANDPFNTSFTIPTASPDRNYFTLRAGLTGTFANGIAAFVNLESVLGLADTKSHSLTGGVRVEF